MTASAVPDAVVSRLRAMALAALAALVLIGLGWELWLAPTGRGTLALKVLPLAFAVPGMLRHRLYTFRWLSLLVWLYVAEGAVRVISETGVSSALAAAEIAAAVALFALCAAYIRRRLRAGARLAA